MKRIVLSFAALGLMAVPALAQEKAIVETGFGSNWFIQGQIGGSYTLSEDRKGASFGDLLSPHAAISLGKYFSPLAGARLQVAGWESKNRYKTETTDGTYKINYVQANLDGLLNLTNLFMSYKEDRAFNLYGIAGLGYVHTFKNKDRDYSRTNSLVPRAGLQADFRLNNNVSFNLEVAGNLMSDNFNGRVEGKKNDATVNALAGLTYRFGKGKFEQVDIIDPSQLSALNDKVNAQLSELRNKDNLISTLQTQLAAKPEPSVIVKETKEVKEETEILMNAVVVFRLGSAQLEQNQDINIYNAARYLKDNPKVNVIVTGYADKSTGTAIINQKLSEKRAEAVAKILTDKHGISANRITVKASGDKEQLFPTDAWNRVVVFTAK